MDNYQAVYDAVRSQISRCDTTRAIEDAAARAFDMGTARQQLSEQIYAVATEMQRPSAIYRPAISIDGNKWCALYGDNLQDGVAGFGDSPAEAMADFDKSWTTKLGCHLG